MRAISGCEMRRTSSSEDEQLSPAEDSTILSFRLNARKPAEIRVFLPGTGWHRAWTMGGRELEGRSPSPSVEVSRHERHADEVPVGRRGGWRTSFDSWLRIDERHGRSVSGRRGSA